MKAHIVKAEARVDQARDDVLARVVLHPAQAETAGNLLVFDSLLDEVAQRELVNLLMAKAGGFAAVFCGSDAEGWRYVIGSLHRDLRAGAKAINAAVGGRGGGKPQMIMGRASAGKREIERALADLTWD